MEYSTHQNHWSIRGMSRMARCIMSMLGWSVEGGRWDAPKCVVLAVPHTTNWDLFFTLLSAMVIQSRMWFMMKHTHFWWPMGSLWRALGGVPINRTKSSSVVSQMAQAFADSDHLHLVIPPEGTRKKVEHWKTGFYYIALEAGVPVWPWFINYRTRRTGSGPLLEMTGDIEADFARIRAFYEEKMGPMPEIRPAPSRSAEHS